MDRRTFLKGMIAAAVAPAIVRADWIMPVRSVTPHYILWGDGVHDDTMAFQAFVNGVEVYDPYGGEIISNLSGRTMLVSKFITNTVTITDRQGIANFYVRCERPLDPVVYV